MEEIRTKVCPKCGRELPVTSFHKNRASKDGYQKDCKECKSKYSKEYNAMRSAERKRFKEEAKNYDKMYKVYTNRELAKFEPRDLMLELKARGYEGMLVFKEVKITEHKINLARLE